MKSISQTPVIRLLVLLSATGQAVPAQEIGSRACAGCHAEIYRKYQSTGMARGAGRAGGELAEPAGQVTQGAVEYRISASAKGHLMEFARGGEGVQGSRVLEWFIGSGGLGRSYLFQTDGYLFQAPVSYYASASKWQVSPGYERSQRIDLTRAVETACLQCHTSRVQPVAGTQNRFASPPFLEGGVSCERCHGPGQAHAARKGPIVNPRKLAAEARDSVCAQCHLTGAARVARANRTPYRPGSLFSAGTAVFVWEDAGADVSATSHYERLGRSACKKASGDKLWCGTCHDPHETSGPEAYRAKCLSCHGATAATKACTNGENCTGCHMPKGESHMVEHVAFTDHGIVRSKQAAAVAASGPRRLVPFFPAVNDRDAALAYAVAAMTEPSVRRTALEQLEAAAEANPTDVPVLAQLAQFYDRMGREDQAMSLCERVLKLDPRHTAAAVNLGIYRVKRGDTAAAIALWQSALERNPALTGARVNLAVAQYQAGKLEVAEAALVKALEFDPDSETAAKLLAEVRAARR